MVPPPAPRYESPVDRAIREAMQRGEFDDLPGAGKPLPEPVHADPLLQRYLQQGDGANAGFLPPSLLLRREAEDLPARAAQLRTEQAVRNLVTDLNRRISDEIRMPTWGPPLAMRPLDVEQVLDRWRDDRRALADRQAADAAAIREIRQERRGDRRRPLPWPWRRRRARGGGAA